MNNEEMLSQIKDTILHKKLILDSCLLLSEYFFSIGNDEIALNLLKRASTHDISKFQKKELMSLASIPKNAKAFKNPNTEMSEEERKHIELHWKNNAHHPEHYEDYNDMTEIDMLEMICDWHARSIQFDTNFLEFVTTRQENRFHFNKEQFDYIYKYCVVLNKLYEESKK